MFQSSRVEVVVLPTSEDGRSSPPDVLNRLDLYRERYDLGPQDQLWLMIDVDGWHAQNKLADVCREAKQCGIRLAVSNPCFELWLWVHHAEAEAAFVDSEGREKQKCKTIEDKLRQQLGSYSKSNLDVTPYMPRVEDAVRRAKALDVDADALWPAQPGTHVYKVIAGLPRSI